MPLLIERYIALLFSKLSFANRAAFTSFIKIHGKFIYFLKSPYGTFPNPKTWEEDIYLFDLSIIPSIEMPTPSIIYLSTLDASIKVSMLIVMFLKYESLYSNFFLF